MPSELIIQKLGIPCVDVMKIDVQAHEIPVLIGMQRPLEGKYAKLVIVEVHFERDVQIKEITAIMDR